MRISALEEIHKVRSWKSGDKRAPHKPLLMIYAIAKLHQGHAVNSYKEVDEGLSRLLEHFGPPRKMKTEYPFLKLANDGIWEVRADVDINTTQEYSSKKLNELNAVGQFRRDIQEELSKHKHAQQVIDYLLNENFPESLHEDILNAIGWDVEMGWAICKRRKRDPAFRERILEAYERKCAICGYHVGRGDQLVGIEAAHIKWHQAGGPDVEQNGVAMCTMHHKLFDYGLFAIDPELLVKVSTKVNGGFGLNEWLLDFHDKPISRPSKDSHYPEPEFIVWQVNEVFKGSYRD